MLYGLGMLIAATPAHTLLGELSTGTRSDGGCGLDEGGAV